MYGRQENKYVPGIALIVQGNAGHYLDEVDTLDDVDNEDDVDTELEVETLRGKYSDY